MRVAYDATAAATQTAGVGRYTRELLRELVALDPADDFQVVAAADRSRAHALMAALPPGATRELRRLPGGYGLATRVWQRLRLPIPVDVFTQPFDVYHATDFVAPPSARPIITTIHDVSYLLVPELGDARLIGYLRDAVPRTLARSSRIITVSAAVAAEVAAAYPETRDRLVAIPNGVRLQKPPDCGCQATRPSVLIVGTVEPRKNHLAVLRAMRIVRERIRDAELTIVGRAGWRSDEIVEAIQRAEREGWARWLPAADDAELARAYVGAAVVVYPSWYEGFGLPVLEAMSYGIPVVTSDIPALREAAGDAALFANPADAEEIADRIETSLTDTTIRADLSDRGLLRVSGYSWRDAAMQTRRVYGQAKAIR